MYLDVQVLEPGDKQGIGRVVSLYTKGWLPYTLRWQFRVTDVSYPTGFALEAWGDFNGRGVWCFEQDGDWVNITYDWSILANKPLLRRFSLLFKPVFSANHHWAMAKGEESMRLEAGATAGTQRAGRSHIAPPPKPTFASLIGRGRPFSCGLPTTKIAPVTAS